MCYAIYVASDSPLDLIPWDLEDRKLNVSKITARDEVIRSRFTKPHVYYVGSHLGCGCGFFYESSLGPEDDEKVVATEVKRSLEELKGYLRESLVRSQELELYVSWEGEKPTSPIKSVSLGVQSIQQLELHERWFYVIGRI